MHVLCGLQCAPCICVCGFAVRSSSTYDQAEQEAKLFRATAEIKQDYERSLQDALEDQRRTMELKTGFFTPCLPARLREPKVMHVFFVLNF